MPRQRESSSDGPVSRGKPGSTPEAREAQMIDLADRLAEKQLREGTASAQVITHYLKLGSSREFLEQQKLALETELVKAKTEALAGQARYEDLVKDALLAMRSYTGQSSPSDLDEG